MAYGIRLHISRVLADVTEALYPTHRDGDDLKHLQLLPVQNHQKKQLYSLPLPLPMS